MPQFRASRRGIGGQPGDGGLARTLGGSGFGGRTRKHAHASQPALLDPLSRLHCSSCWAGPLVSRIASPPVGLRAALMWTVLWVGMAGGVCRAALLLRPPDDGRDASLQLAPVARIHYSVPGRRTLKRGQPFVFLLIFRFFKVLQSCSARCFLGHLWRDCYARHLHCRRRYGPAEPV